MGNYDISHVNMTGWDGTWHWFMSFHGLFALVSLVVIVFACVALYHDWREDRLDDQK